MNYMCEMAKTKNLSNKDFGLFYNGLIKDVLNLKISEDTQKYKFTELEQILGGQLQEIQAQMTSHSVEDILSSSITKDLGPNDYAKLDHKLLAILVEPPGFTKIGKKHSNGFASLSTEVPYIVLRNRSQNFNDKNVMHEAQHVLYDLLMKGGQMQVHRDLSNEDKKDFVRYRNELLSTLAETATPFGYTVNRLSRASDYVQQHAFPINDMFKNIVRYSDDKLNHADFMKGVFFANKFEELAENILQTAEGLHIKEEYFENVTRNAYGELMDKYLHLS